MSTSALPPGHRVVVAQFAESPPEAIEGGMDLVSMEAPDVTRLAPTDVVVAIRSASVGWVDLLMTSGQYQHMPRPPYTPGLEYAGEVAAGTGSTWAGGVRPCPGGVMRRRG